MSSHSDNLRFLYQKLLKIWPTQEIEILVPYINVELLDMLFFVIKTGTRGEKGLNLLQIIILATNFITDYSQ